MKHLSTYNNDISLLKAFSDIYLKGKWFDADITYSKGVFYKNALQPKIKSDLIPLSDDVTEMDSQILSHLQDNSVQSIIFDPPFLFRNRKSANKDKISSRFSCFNSFQELIEMYKNTLEKCHQKLIRNGYLFFKCQDMTDGKFYCTHNHIINMASNIGYELRDIGIKINNHKLQRDAKQQNCLAKTHSYWLVFKKRSKNNRVGE